ncbi:MAG: protease pro-enzyme activation domain-containing protein [Terracidiphilus sp.]
MDKLEAEFPRSRGREHAVDGNSSCSVGRRAATRAFVRSSIGALLLPAALAFAPARAQAQGAYPSVSIGNAVKARLYAAGDRGPVAPTMLLPNMQIELRIGDAQLAALEAFAANQQNPQSPDYRLWLTPEQIAARFGSSQADAARVAAWLASAGMSGIRVSRSRLFITYSGSAAAVEAAFETPIHTFNVRGARHFANLAAPAVPASLSGLIAGVVGIDDFTPVSQLVQAPTPQYAAGAGQNVLGPADLATIYDIDPLYARGISGSGVTVAVLGQTPIALGDYRAYRAFFGLPANDFQSVEVPNTGAGTDSTADLEEATLDLEAAGAVARSATILYVWGTNVEVAAEYAIDNQLAQVMSLSYAGCETGGDSFYQILALQAAVEGITWVSAAGDSGAAGCEPIGAPSAAQGLDVMVPASAPAITAVGGTAFSDGSSSQYWSSSDSTLGGSALSYVPETGWSSQTSVLAGGGGVSNIFPKPGYQSSFAPSVASGRMVPDVSLAASPTPDPYLIVYNGSNLLVGGTSAATPVFAGIAALVNHYLLANGSIAAPGLGDINPVLYLLAENSPNVFHDVVTGSNDVPCSIGSADCAAGTLGYRAQSGYDLATGLGSVDAYALASNWATATFQQSTAVLSASASGTQAEQSVTLAAAATAGGSPLAGSPVEFYYTNPQSQSSRAMLGSAITDASGTATLAVNLLPIGVNTVTAVDGGTTTVAESPDSNTVSVSVSAFPTSVAIASSGGPYRAGQTVAFAIQVAGSSATALSGPDPLDPHYVPGSVSLYSAAGALLAASVLAIDGSATLNTPALAAGDNSFYVSYSGDYYAAASQSPIVTLTAAAQTGSATTTNLSASAGQVAFGNSVTFTATVAPASGSATPAGSVTFFNGASALATVAVGQSGAAAFTFVPAPAGTVTLTAVYGGSGSFDSSTSAPLSVIVSEPVPDFQLSGATAVSVAAGSAASIVLSIKPLNGFAGTIQLSCSGVPSGSSCSLPANVTPAGTATVTVTLVTAGATLAAGIPFVFFIFVSPTRGKRRLKRLAALALAAVALAILPGCSAVVVANSGTLSSQNYTVTVTATSGSIAHQVGIDVTVTP